MATITVLADIKAAPIAGESSTPNGRNTPAAADMAMMGKLPYTSIRGGIFAHPTLAESLNDLLMMMDMPG